MSKLEYDVVYLTAGAFENIRILKNSEKDIPSLKAFPNSFKLKDHISFISHDIYNSDFNIDKVNLNPKIFKNGLITKRIRINNDGKFGFIHTTFNEEVFFFQVLKKILFGIKLNQKITIKKIATFFPQALLFFFSFLFNKLYIDKSKNSIIIDLDKTEDGSGKFNFKNGEFYIDWKIHDDEVILFKEIQKKISIFLKRNGIDFKELNLNTADKIVDAYHPTCLLAGKKMENTFVSNKFNLKDENIFIFSTSLLKYSKSINPTAAVFPLIEHHINDFYEK